MAFEIEDPTFRRFEWEKERSRLMLLPSSSLLVREEIDVGEMGMGRERRVGAYIYGGGARMDGGTIEKLNARPR